MKNRHYFAWTISILVIVILILPTLAVVPISFSGNASFVFPPKELSLRWYENFFVDRSWRRSLVNSLQIAVLTSVVATLAGTAAALGLARWRRRAVSSILQSVLVLPLIIPGIILALGIYAVFSNLHLIGTTEGFVLAHAVVTIPYVIITVGISIASVDPRLEQAAAGLGASSWGVFRQVTLPLILPGVVSGALFAFVTSFDEVVISLFIKSPFKETLPVKMYASMTESIDPTIAAASTMVLLFTTLLLIVFSMVQNPRKKSKKLVKA